MATRSIHPKRTTMLHSGIENPVNGKCGPAADGLADLPARAARAHLQTTMASAAIVR
jgi:hypothetical protein